MEQQSRTTVNTNPQRPDSRTNQMTQQLDSHVGWERTLQDFVDDLLHNMQTVLLTKVFECVYSFSKTRGPFPDQVIGKTVNQRIEHPPKSQFR